MQQNSPAAAPPRSLWSLGWQRLKRDRVGYVSLWIVGVFALVAALVWTGLLAGNWNAEISEPNTSPLWVAHEKVAVTSGENELDGSTGPIIRLAAAEDPINQEMEAARKNAARYKTREIEKTDSLILGSDQRGRSVMQKVLQGTATSMLVGIFGALLSVLLGTLLGAFAGYFGRRTDDFLMWFYSVFTSVPDMLLLLAFAAVSGRGFTTLVLVLSFTSWTATFRLVRAEFMKQRSREYVQAADAIGASHLRRMFVHILPNISHLLLVQFSLLLVGLIKYEVILSFLGFGVGVKQVSWGSILGEVPNELLQGYWWQLLAVVLFMSTLVTAVSLLTDALRDALDPKVK
ncbi:ABC transporter permease [Uliginosibacterium paludis]|uniref:ABC transporter permease n=1 Tax=Uliginosibacterium paludis TaxID=1615952 RepID=A0ABV2CV13_9RHOO